MSDCLSLAPSFLASTCTLSGLPTEVSFEEVWNHAISLRRKAGNSKISDEDLLNLSQIELTCSYVDKQRELFDHYSMPHNGSKCSDSEDSTDFEPSNATDNLRTHRKRRKPMSKPRERTKLHRASRTSEERERKPFQPRRHSPSRSRSCTVSHGEQESKESPSRELSQHSIPSDHVHSKPKRKRWGLPRRLRNWMEPRPNPTWMSGGLATCDSVDSPELDNPDDQLPFHNENVLASDNSLPITARNPVSSVSSIAKDADSVRSAVVGVGDPSRTASNGDKGLTFDSVLPLLKEVLEMNPLPASSIPRPSDAAGLEQRKDIMDKFVTEHRKKAAEEQGEGSPILSRENHDHFSRIEELPSLVSPV